MSEKAGPPGDSQLPAGEDSKGEDSKLDPEAEALLERLVNAAFQGSEPPSEVEELATVSLLRLFDLSENQGGIQAEGSAERPPKSDSLPERLGRYRVIAEVARGGLGAVYRVQDPILGRDLAAKTLLPKLRGRDDACRRFIEEAQIAGQLHHPGIAPLHELGVLPDGSPFFTMKLVKGQTLAARLDRRSLPDEDLPRLLAVFEQVAQAIAYAHARGVIHRDLKPSNIMVGAFGEVQVMDWGLAKVLAEGGIHDERRARRTHAERSGPQTEVRTGRSSGAGSRSLAGSVLGTPAYMPPEQARGEIEELDERSDVFSLGAILCEILTGEPPYCGSSVEEILSKAAAGDLAEARERIAASSADPRIVALARRCLEAKPRERPRDAGAVARDLEDHRASLEAGARAAEVEAAEAFEKACGERRARRLTLGIAGAVILSILAGLGSYFALERDRERRAAAAGRSVEEALGEADLLFAEASAARSLERWPRALEAARRAAAAAAAEGVAPALRERSGSLLERIAAGEKGAREALSLRERERAIAARLEGIVSRLEHLEPRRRSGAAASIGAAIGELWPDWPSLDPAAAAARARGSSIQAEILLALDARHEAIIAGRGDPPAASRLRAVASDLDGDPQRAEIRRALGERRVEELRERGRAFARLEVSPYREENGRLARVDPLPEAPPARTLDLLCGALDALGNRKRAEAVARKAILFHPGDARLHHRLVVLLLDGDVKDPWAARRHAGAVTALRGEDPHAWDDQGRADEAWGEPDAAAEAYARARELPGCDGEVALRLGVALWKSGAAERAAGALREAEALLPGDPRPPERLGALLHRLGDLDGAAAALRRAATLESAIDTAATASRQDGFGPIPEGAPEDPRAATAGDIQEELARVLEAKRDGRGAADTARHAVELSPCSPDASRILGSALLELGEARAAKAPLERAAGIDAQDAAARLLLALARLREGEAAEGLADLLAAGRLAPVELVAADGYNGEERGRLDLGGLAPAGAALPATARSVPRARLEEAREALRAAAGSLPPAEAESALVEAASFDLRLGSAASAAAALRGLGGAPAARSLLGAALAALAWERPAEKSAERPAEKETLLAEARENLERALEISPADPVARNSLGVVLLETGRSLEALDAFQRASKEAGALWPPQRNLARALFHAGRLREANEAAERALELEQALSLIDPDLENLEGEIRCEAGESSVAAERFRAALEEAPRHALASRNLARCNFQTGRLESGIEGLRACLARSPGDPRSWNALGAFLNDLGRSAEALEAFRRAEALASDRWLGGIPPLRERIVRNLAELQLLSGDEAGGILTISPLVGKGFLEGGGLLSPKLEARLAWTESEKRDPRFLEPLLRTLDRLLRAESGLPPEGAHLFLRLWFLLPDASVETDPLALARSEVERSFRRDPGALERLAEVLERKGEKREACRILEEAVGTAADPEALGARLESRLAAIRPDLPTYGAIDDACDRAETLLAPAAPWKRRIAIPPPAARAGAGASWIDPAFDDREWVAGPLPLRYGRGKGGTVLEELPGASAAVCARASFQRPAPGRFRRLVLRVKADDGFVAYLNGAEIARSRAGSPGAAVPPEPRADAEAPALLENETFELPGERLLDGANTIALLGLNLAPDDGDFLLEAEVYGEPSESEERARFDAFRTASADAPDHGRRLAYFEARLLQRSGKPAEAAERLRSVLAEDRSRPEPFRRLRESLRATLPPVEVGPALREAIARGEIPSALRSLPPETPANSVPREGALVGRGPVLLETTPYFSFGSPGEESPPKSLFEVRAEGESYERSPVWFQSLDPGHIEVEIPRDQLLPSTTYHWRVTYRGKNGQRSAASRETSFRTGDFPFRLVNVDLSRLFDRDVVLDPGDSEEDPFDDSQLALTVEGFNGRSAGDPSIHGLPAGGRLGVHRLGDYDRPNAIQLLPGSPPVRIDVPPGRYSSLRFVAAGSGGFVELPTLLEFAEGPPDRLNGAFHQWYYDPRPMDYVNRGTPIASNLVSIQLESRRVASRGQFLWEFTAPVSRDRELTAIILDPRAKGVFFHRDNLSVPSRLNLFAITGVLADD